jgi:hypothetical protein
MFIPRTILGTLCRFGSKEYGGVLISVQCHCHKKNRRILFYLFLRFKSGIHVAKNWLNYFLDDGHTKLATSQNPSEKHWKIPGS